MLRSPEIFIFQSIGQILLSHKIFLVIVSIFITCVIAELLHELCGSITQMQRNRLVTAFLNFRNGFVKSRIA